jgi:hypothetical protein
MQWMLTRRRTHKRSTAQKFFLSVHPIASDFASVRS